MESNRVTGCILSETEKLIHLTITDDGRGIDIENFRKKAVDSGLMTMKEVNLLTELQRF